MKSVQMFRLSATVIMIFSILSCSQSSEESLRERVQKIHEEAIVIDAHAHPKSNEAERLNLGEHTGEIEVDFVSMAEGGLDAVFYSAPLLRGQSGRRPDPEQILKDIDLIHSEVEKYKEMAKPAISPDDIRSIHDSGKRAILLGIETRDPFRGDLNVLKRYYDAGVRMITLTRHPITTPVEPDSSDAETGTLHLNNFGRHVVREMNRLGMIIDISHASDSLQLDIIQASSLPVVASHSCARALNDIPREIPDDIITVLAEKGGVICVTFFPGHISPKHPDQPVSVEDLVDHIDHIVQLVGTDHVGFGSDYLGSDTKLVGLESAAGLPSITHELLNRGYCREDIHKIMGGNLMRVFEAVYSHDN
jgi:membrane dipeptidase